MKKTPERTCIVCRKKGNKNDFVRIVKKENLISVDLYNKLDGRGCYICKDKSCVEKAVKTKALNRAFKCNVDNEVYNAILQIRE